MSSPASPTIATGWPSFTSAPGGTRILSNVALSKERNSIVALSVSTSASRSSTAMGSPSFLCQAERTPSSMVGDSSGISRIFAIAASQNLSPLRPRAERPQNGRYHSLGLGHARQLELPAVGHGHVERRHAEDRAVERIEGEALHAIGNLGPDAAVRPS